MLSAPAGMGSSWSTSRRREGACFSRPQGRFLVGLPSTTAGCGWPCAGGGWSAVFAELVDGGYGGEAEDRG